MTLYVAYVPATGHVVGAVNVTGAVPPDNVGELVGPALPLRIPVAGEMVTLPLPANQLALLEADDEPDVFADPMRFGVGDSKPTLVRLSSWGENEDVALTTDSLVVTVPVPNVSRLTPVLALVADGQDLHILAGAIPAGEESLELPITASSGTHGVLVLVAGWVGILRTLEKQ